MIHGCASVVHIYMGGVRWGGMVDLMFGGHVLLSVCVYVLESLPLSLSLSLSLSLFMTSLSWSCCCVCVWFLLGGQTVLRHRTEARTQIIKLQETLAEELYESGSCDSLSLHPSLPPFLLPLPPPHHHHNGSGLPSYAVGTVRPPSRSPVYGQHARF